jgi:hypothetical protein
LVDADEIVVGEMKSNCGFEVFQFLGKAVG